MNLWRTRSSIVFDNARRVVVASKGLDNLREIIDVEEDGREQKSRVARACKSTTVGEGRSILVRSQGCNLCFMMSLRFDESDEMGFAFTMVW